MNELKATEALLEDQRAVNQILREQLEELRNERNHLKIIRDRALNLVEAQYHHGGLPVDYAEPLLKILRGDLGVILRDKETS